MKRIDYFKLAIKHKLYEDKDWLIRAFTVTKGGKEIEVPYDIIVKSWGYVYKDEAGEEIKIEDGVVNEPLLKFSDPITMEIGDLPNVKETTLTTLGQVIFNAICIVNPFGSKVDFMTGRVNLGKLDSYIAERLTDNPMSDDGELLPVESNDPTVIYVSEHIKYLDALEFIAILTQISSPVVTKKMLVAPPGIKEFKEKLLVKYQGKLSDPVEVVNFEKELLAFDDAFLKDDPTYGKFLSGKIKNVARKKMFLTIGSEDSFDSTVGTTPVINSLNEGWSTESEDLVKVFNGLRLGSYARGAETVKGGVSAKILLRAGNSFTIEPGDCGTKFGIDRSYTDVNVESLVGRYIIIGENVVLIDKLYTAKQYVGKKLVVRSPAFCKKEGDKICSICAGANLNRFPKGLTIPLTEVSAIILISSLKKMHGSAASTVPLDLNEVLS